MARHFIYKHLPASGLGHRDPRRPHVTGGLGLGLPTFITDVLERRIYRGRGRDTMVMDRSLLNEVRDLATASRWYANGSRYRDRIDRILDGIGRTLSKIGRSYRGGDRDMGSGGRDLE
jgi:hypothetical protein